MVNDPEIISLSTKMLLIPRNLKQCNELLMESFASCLLGALIYLPKQPPEPDAESLADTKSLADATSEEPASAPEKGPEKTLIGFVMLVDEARFSAQTRACSAVISLASRYVNQGYGTEVLQWLINWGFCYANLHRISLSVNSFNDRAIASYKKLGFVEEGRARETVFFDREWYDTINISILEQEWEARRRK
ncbi:hypothetical protein NLG97_g3668 [Lecanicillium saksenae]|uniref:Uncharacterized protein n=1 Tax=Lecanicillium saksenae TaxID=468837 RepID=A0ACC1QYV1_9HYPO|nr:hypothetical protein NLG97_g3668 [Lecanicillium saksenae]